MKDVLQLVYEYRRLVAKRDLMGATLSAKALERLDALERLFGREPEPDGGPAAGLRRHARCEVDASAVMRLQGTDHTVEVVNVGGGGLCVANAPEMTEGEQAILRIQDGDSVYQYQVEARWCDHQNRRLGLPFVGVPRALPVSVEPLSM